MNNNRSLLELTIPELHSGLLSGNFSIVEIVEQAYRHIETHNPTLNALITIKDKKKALKEAEIKQKELKEDTSLLYGIPYILKDSYVTQDLPTTAASHVLKDFHSPYNATVHQRLQDTGAILIGKANMDAWGHGGSTENTDFGPAKNPFDLNRSPGGSSGGVAAAIASRMCVFGIGEDTGGSIRNPAGWTNTTGLKVTYGRVSRYGCIAYASSFDTVGPMAKTAIDTASVLTEIAGLDKYDATSSPEKPDDYLQNLNESQLPITIGIPNEVQTKDLNPAISQLLKQTKATLKKLRHKVIDLSMPSLTFALPVYYLIAPSETSSNLARYDSVRYGQDRSHFTPETMRRIMIGTFALSTGYYDAYYKQAQKARTLLIQEYQKAFETADVILMPTSPTPPPLTGQLVADPLTNMLADVFTVTQNLVGVPSLAIPGGFTPDNLPVGIQFSAPKFQESLLLKLGHQFQQVTNYHQSKPNT